MTQVIKLTKDMFKSGQPIAQGELRIWLKEYAPKSIIERLNKSTNLKEIDATNGMIVVGHSETGAHHVLERPVKSDVPVSLAAQALIDSANDTICELRLQEDMLLSHSRPADNHKTYLLPAGTYIQSTDQENTVEGWVKVAD